MFRKFVETILLWVKENQIVSIESAYTGFDSPVFFQKPDLTSIQDNFILSIIPPSLSDYIRQHPFHIDLLRKRFFGFGNYISERKIAEHLESSILTDANPQTIKILRKQFLAFLSSQNNWQDNSWHLQLTSNIRSAFNLISNTLKYDDPWICATFLANCGYPVPHSRFAFEAWKRYSGQADEKSSFMDWWDLLDDISDMESCFQIDQMLDAAFNPSSPFISQTLCLSKSSCNLCPLEKSCVCIDNDFTNKTEFEGFNAIKTGDIKNVPTEELLQFLLDDMISTSEFQRETIRSFPKITHQIFLNALTKEDEKLLIKLLSIKEISQRLNETESPIFGVSFSNAKEIFDHFKTSLSNEAQESFYTLLLDNKHRIIDKRLVTLGTLNQSLVHPREVFAPAIQLRAAAIILIHNHPSGDSTPSNQDIAITQRLQDVGDIVGIKVLDHIIVGRDQFFSFVDEGLLN